MVEIAGDTILERGRGLDDDDDDDVVVVGGTLFVCSTIIGNPKTTTDDVLLLLLLKRLVSKTNNNVNVTATPLDVSGEDMTDRIEIGFYGFQMAGMFFFYEYAKSSLSAAPTTNLVFAGMDG
mmetsp:Transcript_9166/g.23213  ORF Transcript_9166/g.23213 Transcript_9166/m.23213 type:complete len:122 (-) Transcript_9166:92-457(-)